MKTEINLWELISRKACTDEETKELQARLGGTNRYPMQEITLKPRKRVKSMADVLSDEKETEGWVLDIHSVDSHCNDNVRILIPADRREPISVEERVEVTKFITRKAST